MKDYTRYSYWLESSGDDLTRPSLNGTIDAVSPSSEPAIPVLWTARYLLERESDLNIAIL